MRNPFKSPFGAIFQMEVLLNSKRVAPYAMAILCGGNALLWWGWGPATGRGWATNSDFFIAGVLPVYSFMTLPLFTAVIMGDPVIRDFRTGVAPLIFSKPVSRAEYLLGKFFGNFFVLACCQSAFVLTLFVLQAVRKQGVIVQDARAFPYLKHFLVFVVISHMVLAAFYFTVGTITRNAKIVYGLGFSFYPLYITYQTVLIKRVPLQWRRVLDPLLMNWGDKSFHSRSAEWANQFIVVYDSDLIVNRAAMILIAAACLTILYIRFAKTERLKRLEDRGVISTLDLSTEAERVYTPESFGQTFEEQYETSVSQEKVALPTVSTAGEGFRANLKKMGAALSIEFRLLRTERSLVLIIPLAVFLSTLELAFYTAVPAPSYAATYASSTAQALLIFLFGITVFYTGEAMHRDREIRIEPILWSAPSPDYVLLLSKFLSTVLLNLSLITLVALVAIAVQIYKGHMPIEISGYLTVYSVILIPSAVFIAGASVLLNVILRDKYLAYAVSIGAGVGLFYLYSQGYNDWLYNPVLYQLWSYTDLMGGGSAQARILAHRIYFLAIASACLSLAHICFQRKSTKGFLAAGHLSSMARLILIGVASVAVAVVAGFFISSSVR